MKSRNLFRTHAAVRRASKRRLLLSLACVLAIASLCASLFDGASSSSASGGVRAKRRATSTSARGAKASASRRRRRGGDSIGVLGRKLAGVKRAPVAEPVQEEEEERESAEAGEDPDGRQKWFYFKRTYPFDSIPANSRRAAWERRPASGGGKGKIVALEAQQSWVSIGPVSTVSDLPANWGVVSGRINAVAISPADPQVILVGAATGGIWRSNDGGATFAPASDSQVDLAVGAIAFAPGNPSIIYAGMGDIDNGYLGTGVLKSTDGGVNWTRVSNSTLPAPGTVSEIKVDPSNPNRVYLAQYTANYNNALFTTNLTNASGLFVSNDGGTNWRRTIAGLVRDIAIHPTNPQVVYIGARRIDVPGVVEPLPSGQPAGVYKSTDGGETWTNVYATPFVDAEQPLLTRDVRLAVTPADPQRLYVYIGKTVSPSTVKVVSSPDGGQTWTDRGGAGLDTGQFGYNTYLYADPANADTLYVGARDVYKSTDGGSSWTNLTRNFSPAFQYQPDLSGAHPDQQSFAFSPANPNVIYIGNDGGLYKSTNAGASFQSLNATLNLSQFNGISLHPTDPNISYAGSQDNGTQRRSAGTNQWTEFAGGDGGQTVVNPLDPSMVFATYIYGTIWRYTGNGQIFSRTVGTNTTFGEATTGDARPRIAFYPPFKGNGVNQRLYFGTWRLFVSDNLGNNWTAPAGFKDLTRGAIDLNAVPPRTSPDVLNAIGVSRSNTQVIYTGSAQGRSMVSTDGGVNWREMSGLPNRFIESITVDPSNPANAYLAVSGYGSGHVFKTVNGTDPNAPAWSDISGNLPNIPTNALLIDPLNPSTLYAGTDIGVFRSTSGGNVWETFNNGLPPVVVTGFAAQSNGRIQLSTYGRGAYELLTTTPPPEGVVSLSAANYSASEGDGRVRISVTRTDATGAASVDYATTDATASERSDYNAALGTLRFAPGESAKSFDIFITDDALSEPTETFTLTLTNPVGLIPGEPKAATVNIASNDAATGANPVKDPTFDSTFFVRQHYIDFFNREPDAAGLAFWKNQIDECTTQACREIRRINVSAAFFVSGEFQQTGYLVYRFYQAAFNTGEHLPLGSFLPDTQQIGRGIVVGQPGADTQLEANKQAYAQEFVSRPPFVAQYPLSLTNAQFVDALNANTGNALTQAERDALANGSSSRAQILRAIAENQEFARRQYSRAFVLMQYFGYLRRNPNDAPELGLNFDGYNFWLGKLNQFGGNYISAEMVKAFITSTEYQQRFGQ